MPCLEACAGPLLATSNSGGRFEQYSNARLRARKFVRVEVRLNQAHVALTIDRFDLQIVR
jgi:hypothetical protein